MALADIEHIVVLVMENRSFDHTLGYLSLEGGRADVDGLKSSYTNPRAVDGTVLQYGPFHLRGRRFDPGPSHHYDHVRNQLDVDLVSGRATMQGFVEDYAIATRAVHPEQVMGYLNAGDVPVYDFFANHYSICDRWFASVPGPTHINRAFLLAGHSGGFTENKRVIEDLWRQRLPTVFRHLSERRVTWHSYFHDAPALAIFGQWRQLGRNVRSIHSFFKAIEKDRLPSVSWIDPNFDLQGTIGLPEGRDPLQDAANDDHPPADVHWGQILVAKIYNALISNPAIWEKTLFIVTYDEHGGFFDHVEPPVRPDRAPDSDEAFNRFGVRVPTFLLSPWVKEKDVVHDELEHTSIARTILDRFAPGCDLTDLRQRLAGAPSLAPYLSSAMRTDRPIAPVVVRPGSLPQVVGGISDTPTDLDEVPESELQRDYRTLRERFKWYRKLRDFVG